MRKIKWFVPLLTVSLLSPLTVAPSAASAAERCPSRSICLYKEGNFEGPMQAISGYTRYQDLASWMHDEASSWRSTTRNQTMCVFDYVGRNRAVLDKVRPGEQVKAVPYGANDRADAVGFC